MSTTTRLGVVVLAVAVLVGAFVVLRPSNDPAPTAGTAGTVGGRSSAPGTTGASSGVVAVTLTERGGQPVGGTRTIDVRRGQTVRLTIRVDQPRQVHLHGYELEREAAPGRPARLVFPATNEGIFAVELHGDPEIQMARLVVHP